MKIIIPSYKRPGLNPTLDSLPLEIVEKYVYIAVRDEEYQSYKEAHPNVKIHNLGKGIDGIVETRQRINEQFTGKIMVIDDDVFFMHTINPEGKDYIKRGDRLQSPEEYIEMFNWIENLLDEYSFGSMRNLNFLRPATWLPYTINKVCYWVFLFNLETFDYKKCSFRNGPPSGLAEDTYLFLDWFDKGNDIFILTKWNIDQTTQQNGMVGGCNSPDRGIKYKNSMEELHRMYPQYTKLKESKFNTKLYGFEVPTLKTRLNVNNRTQIKKSLF